MRDSFDVFISYSHKDKLSADAVCAGLEAAGIRCWIAPRDIDPGGEWAEGIIGGLNRCRVMVLIFSTNANQSHQVRREVERAVHREMAILPFRIENVTPGSKLEYFLSNLHWLDALTPPLTAHVERLTSTIKSLLISSGADAVSAAPSSVALPQWGGGMRLLGRRWLLAAAGALVVAAAVVAWWIGRPVVPEYDRKVMALAETIRNDINSGTFDDANKALTALTSLAPSNGHTYYFQGELRRISGPNRDIYKTIDWFVRYMDDPRSNLVHTSSRLDEQVCYDSPEGFCRQRTGWIGHLLANLFYRLSTDETVDEETRGTFLRQAEQYVHISLDFYPKGFEATIAPPTQLVDNAWSSRQLVALINARLHK